MKLICPRLSKQSLVADCRALGLKEGDAVMVHASLRSVGEILGGPDVLIDAILETISADGSMMVYLGCQSPFDDIGRGLYSAEEEAFIQENCPPFDPKNSRASRDFGILPEFFRSRTNVLHSGNPGCRMAATGKHAQFLTENHPLNYGLGKDSPLGRFYKLGGKIMLIGSDLDAVTILHYAEALAKIENKKLVHIRVPIVEKKKLKWQEIEEFNSSSGVRDWPERFFAEIIEAFVGLNGLKTSPIGKADTHLLPARDLVDFAVTYMEKEAKKLDGSIS